MTKTKVAPFYLGHVVVITNYIFVPFIVEQCVLFSSYY